jgi:hypothetical protein
MLSPPPRSSVRAAETTSSPEEAAEGFGVFFAKGHTDV